MNTHQHRFLLIIALATAGVAGCHARAQLERGVRDLSEVATSREIDVGGDIERLAISKSGMCLAASVKRGSVSIVDVKSGKGIASLSTRAFDVQRLKFSESGDELLCQGGTGLLNARRWFEVWRVKDGKLLFSNHPEDYQKLFGHGDVPHAWAGDMSPDGKTLLLWGGETTGLYTFDLVLRRGDRIVAPRQVRVLESIEFSPDGQLVTVFAAGPADMDDGTLLVLRAKDYKVQASYSMRGRRFPGLTQSNMIVVAVPAEDRKTVTLRYLGEDVEPPPIELQAKDPGGIIFFADGKRLATLNELTLRIWNVQSGSEEARMQFSSKTEAPAIATAGAFLVTTAGGPTATVWTLKLGDK